MTNLRDISDLVFNVEKTGDNSYSFDSMKPIDSEKCEFTLHGTRHVDWEIKCVSYGDFSRIYHNVAIKNKK